MNRFELIEKLRERADINYEEADQLLSDTQDDLIAALIILEKQGRLKGMRQGLVLALALDRYGIVALLEIDEDRTVIERDPGASDICLCTAYALLLADYRTAYADFPVL